MVLAMMVLCAGSVFAGDAAGVFTGEDDEAKKGIVDEIKDQVTSNTAGQINQVVDNVAGHAGKAALALSEKLDVAVKDMKPALMYIIWEYRFRGLLQMGYAIFMLVMGYKLCKWGVPEVGKAAHSEEWRQLTGVIACIGGVILLILCPIFMHWGIEKTASPAVELIHDVAEIAQGNNMRR
jgi:hypothetical protein